MRALKRWVRRFWAEWCIGPRRKEVLSTLCAYFKEKNLRFIYWGDRGRDSIYLLTSGEKTYGILRLVNPHYYKQPMPADWPFQLEAQGKQIDREWNAYSKGSAAGLTPKPLWRSEDALLCEYIPCHSMHETLLKSPEGVWGMMCRGAKAVQQLHKTGLTHMDVSFANMLEDKNGKIYFIDFEYAPIAGLSIPAQRVYDHLRLLDSSWKFIPESEHKNYQPWLDCMTQCMDEDMKKVDIRPLMPTTHRAFIEPELGEKIRKIFNAGSQR